MQAPVTARSTVPRKTPRGPRTDGEATRARILSAAGELFAATGFAETTSKAIAARAGVDLASINYHFGSRGGLYQAVLAEAHHRLVSVDDLQRFSDSGASAPDKLRLLITQLVERASEQPRGWPLQVLAREFLAPSSHLKPVFEDALRPKFQAIRRMLGEIAGLPEDEPAITRCAVSVAAPCLMLLVGGPNVPGPLREIFQMPRDAVVAHLHRFALGGLQAIAQARESSVGNS